MKPMMLFKRHLFERSEKPDSLTSTLESRLGCFELQKNLCLNQLRNTSRRSAILDANPQADRQAPDQLSALFSGQQSIEMLGAMDKLSTDHREILVLRYFDEQLCRNSTGS